jgi:hypothetical protein
MFGARKSCCLGPEGLGTHAIMRETGKFKDLRQFKLSKDPEFVDKLRIP